MFRDSHGVVHTVSSADPLRDLPVSASAVLTRVLLAPVGGDLGGALERCDAVSSLLGQWQDAFFAALPEAVDRAEEARWAAEAGLSLDDIEAEWEDDDEDQDADWGDGSGLLEPDRIELSELSPLEDEPLGLVELRSSVDRGPLGDDLVAELEVALMLLPLRVRLEALVAAVALVESWSEVFADHEKALGHLMLAHPTSGLLATAAPTHEDLAELHASLHRNGPWH